MNETIFSCGDSRTANCASRWQPHIQSVGYGPREVAGHSEQFRRIRYVRGGRPRAGRPCLSHSED